MFFFLTPERTKEQLRTRPVCHRRAETQPGIVPAQVIEPRPDECRGEVLFFRGKWDGYPVSRRVGRPGKKGFFLFASFSGRKKSGRRPEMKIQKWGFSLPGGFSGIPEAEPDFFPLFARMNAKSQAVEPVSEEISP